MQSEEKEVQVTTSIKIKYDKLKKAGYKLNYGTKTEDYTDIFFVRKIDENISVTLSINERTVTKRLNGASYENSGYEPLTCEEVLAVADILTQLK